MTVKPKDTITAKDLISKLTQKAMAGKEALVLGWWEVQSEKLYSLMAKYFHAVLNKEFDLKSLDTEELHKLHLTVHLAEVTISKIKRIDEWESKDTEGDYKKLSEILKDKNVRVLHQELCELLKEKEEKIMRFNDELDIETRKKLAEESGDLFLQNWLRRFMEKILHFKKHRLIE